MSEEKTQRKWISAQVEETVYNAVMRISAEKGQHPTVTVEEAIKYYITYYVQVMGRERVDALVYVQSIAIEAGMRDSGMRMLRQLAIDHIRTGGSEESADKIKHACESMEIDVETLIADLEASQSLVALVDTLDRPLRKAEDWLARYMEPGREYPMKSLKEAAENAGIRFYTLKQAKVSLNVTSERKSNHWVWKREEIAEMPQDEPKRDVGNAIQRLKDDLTRPGIHVELPPGTVPF